VHPLGQQLHSEGDDRGSLARYGAARKVATGGLIVTNLHWCGDPTRQSGPPFFQCCPPMSSLYKPAGLLDPPFLCCLPLPSP
jgi:hypothetical protein